MRARPDAPRGQLPRELFRHSWDTRKRVSSCVQNVWGPLQATQYACDRGWRRRNKLRGTAGDPEFSTVSLRRDLAKGLRPGSEPSLHGQQMTLRKMQNRSRATTSISRNCALRRLGQACVRRSQRTVSRTRSKWEVIEEHFEGDSRPASLCRRAGRADGQLRFYPVLVKLQCKERLASQ